MMSLHILPAVQEAVGNRRADELRYEDIHQTLGEVRTELQLANEKLATIEAENATLRADNEKLRLEARSGIEQSIKAVAAERDAALKHCRDLTANLRMLEAKTKTDSPEVARLRARVAVLEKEVADSREFKQRMCSILGQASK